jgi:hypothetical protein
MCFGSRVFGIVVCSCLSIGIDGQIPTTSATRTITAFRQAFKSEYKGKGNCDAIATIKLAMTVFGPNKIFLTPTPTLNDQLTYNVTLRNGDTVMLTNQELDLVLHSTRYGSGFALPQKAGDATLMFVANFAYAVMAKEMPRLRDKLSLFEQNTFEDALDVRSDGVDAEVPAGGGESIMMHPVAMLLGFDLQAVAPVDPAPPAYIYSLPNHDAFAEGGLADLGGEAQPLAAVMGAHATLRARFFHRGHMAFSRFVVASAPLGPH